MSNRLLFWSAPPPKAEAPAPTGPPPKTPEQIAAEEAAARRLQRVARGKRGRKRFAAERERWERMPEEAKRAHGFKVRVHKKKREQEAALRLVQSYAGKNIAHFKSAIARIRAVHEGRKQRAIFAQQKAAAKAIASAERGRSQRQRTAHRRRAASTIGASARGFRVKKEIRTLAAAAVVIEAAARGRQMLLSFRRKRDAATAIQAVGRRYIIRARIRDFEQRAKAETAARRQSLANVHYVPSSKSGGGGGAPAGASDSNSGAGDAEHSPEPSLRPRAELWRWARRVHTLLVPWQPHTVRNIDGAWLPDHGRLGDEQGVQLIWNGVAATLCVLGIMSADYNPWAPPTVSPALVRAIKVACAAPGCVLMSLLCRGIFRVGNRAAFLLEQRQPKQKVESGGEGEATGQTPRKCTPPVKARAAAWAAVFVLMLASLGTFFASVATYGEALTWLTVQDCGIAVGAAWLAFEPLLVLSLFGLSRVAVRIRARCCGGGRPKKNSPSHAPSAEPAPAPTGACSALVAPSDAHLSA